MNLPTRLGLLPLLLIATVSCQDTFDLRPSQILAPRLLAVIAEPPEALPGALVKYTAVYADLPTTPPTLAEPAWAYCSQSPRPADYNSIAEACLQPVAPWIVAVGQGYQITTQLPLDACGKFGSEPPPPTPGESAIRPTDPDATGGFYQPLRVGRPEFTFAQIRVGCAPSQATAEVAREFRTRYVPNRNPSVSPIEVLKTSDGLIRLRATIRQGSLESYVVYDLGSRTITPRNEVLRAQWFASNASLAIDSALPNDAATLENVVTRVPGNIGARVWLVLRDDRGGVAYQQLDLP